MTHQDLLQTFAHLAPQQRAQIIAKLKAQGVDLPGDDQAQSEPGSVGQMSPAIPRIDRSAPIPLSFPQEQLWFLHQLEPENPSYHERIGMLLQGSLDVDRLEHAIHTVVRRHESLRTTFKSRDGKNRDRKSREDSGEDRVSDPHQAEQVIHPFDADLFGLTHQPISPQEAHALEALTPDHTVLDETTELAKRIDAHSWRPFDLQRAPLWRLVLFSTAPVADVLIHTGNHLLLFVIHHMIADAWFMATVLQEIAICYTALCHGAEARPPDTLPPLSVTYADFAAWQRTELQGDRLARHLDFWHQSLAGGPPFCLSPRITHAPRCPADEGGYSGSIWDVT